MIEPVPMRAQGKIAEVNDTAVTVDIPGRMGRITVPLRWVFTEKKLEPGLTVEFYFSYMQVR
jgi:hypothetical protein